MAVMTKTGRLKGNSYPSTGFLIIDIIKHKQRKYELTGRLVCPFLKKGNWMRAVRMVVGFAAWIFASGLCFGANDDDSFFPPEMHVAFFGGAGLTNPSGNALHGSVHSGISMEFSSAGAVEKPPIPMGLALEFGYAGPVNDLGNGSALFSLNYMPELVVSHRQSMTSFATVGYTRLFGTGNALNLGVGLNFFDHKHWKRAIRFEVRDYLRFTEVKEHNVAFRAAYVFGANQQ
jgi:hypothetical protein